MRLFRTYLKAILRSRTLVFWTLLFPLILSVLFHFAFSNLNNSETFHPVKAGVVRNASVSEDTGFYALLRRISRKGDDDRVLNLKRYPSVQKAADALAAGKIEGYYLLKDSGAPGRLVVSGSGISQTILREVSNEYQQGVSAVRSLYRHAYRNAYRNAVSSGALRGTGSDSAAPDSAAASGTAAAASAALPSAGQIRIHGRSPEQLYQDTLSAKSVFRTVSSSRTDNTIIYFYTLIGMVCLYGASFGIFAAEETEADLTARAARVTVSPVPKSHIVIAANLAGYVTLYIETVLVILFMDRVLGVAFGSQLGYILLLSAAGCFAGQSFGALLGAAGRGSAEAKQGMTIGITMALCFLGGMMYQDMRYIIKDHVPLLDAVNPVTMITDGLYSLYCYTDHALLWNAVLRLLIFGAVFFAASLCFTGRKTYERI